jgi:hypothetical protein
MHMDNHLPDAKTAGVAAAGVALTCHGLLAVQQRSGMLDLQARSCCAWSSRGHCWSWFHFGVLLACMVA